MMKTRLKISLGFFIVVLSLSICWSAAYFSTNWFYTFYSIQFHPYWVQIINSLLGFFLFGCGMFLLTRLFTHQRQKQAEFYQSIIYAIKQIAQGNFNVSLPKFEGHNPFVEIVDNIHYMSKELAQTERMRQEFVSNVSHEIQSPLTSISGFARALKSEHLSPKDRLHYLSIIETESERLSKLSDNLLKLTYLESAHHSLEPAEYRLDKQIQQAILSCEPQWLDKQIEMEFSSKNLWITANEDLLNQVWMNLLHNAIKFTPTGGTICMSASLQKEKIIVEISDTGIGIAENDQLHLFERFYKADKARSRQTGGSGLGLSIVKKIIDLHNGDIHVRSKLHEGTTIVLTFPPVHSGTEDRQT
ncbi:two-component sensor histidine kinase [Bacillus sp. J14TS2]|uniref:sensor histidine kinase n=1 Tax=Bacillus sp. J14TS2 TaxID=2807188 RepID=UPI001B01ECB4|nr:HAMP domain-containing sensor histidine kinase [Bacillus sp. J14TS2]GIN70587.1 two-component sensor histidine kinase [Bacillus sp. J14TS2]